MRRTEREPIVSPVARQAEAPNACAQRWFPFSATGISQPWARLRAGSGRIDPHHTPFYPSANLRQRPIGDARGLWPTAAGSKLDLQSELGRRFRSKAAFKSRKQMRRN